MQGTPSDQVSSYSDQSYELYADILIEMAREAWCDLNATHRQIVSDCLGQEPNYFPSYPCGIPSYAQKGQAGKTLSLPELIIEAYGMQKMHEGQQACNGDPNAFLRACADKYFRHAAEEYNGHRYVLAIDTARALHPFWNIQEPERLLLLNRCTRGIGDWVSTKLYHYLLENKDEAKVNQVRLVFAAQGSGKSRVTHALNEENSKAITLDGIYDDTNAMKALVHAALAKNLPVSIVYIHTPAIVSATRAIDRTLEDGRPIRLSQIPKRNKQLRNQVIALEEAYRDHPQVGFDLWMNGGLGEPIRYIDFMARKSPRSLSNTQIFQEFVRVTRLQEDKSGKEAAAIKEIFKSRVAFAEQLRDAKGIYGMGLKPKDTHDFGMHWLPLNQVMADQFEDPDRSWSRLISEVEVTGNFFELLENSPAPKIQSASTCSQVTYKAEDGRVHLKCIAAPIGVTPPYVKKEDGRVHLNCQVV